MRSMVEAWGLTLTAEVALQVRHWRAEGSSFRVIAACADEAWGTDTRGNHLFGEDLCLESARMLGENPYADPWI
jgi:hypothetical protein